MVLGLMWLGMVLGGHEAAAAAVDFADGTQREMWLRHPVYGDPSFDTFVRAEGNPLHRGEPPFEWPVNGFLFGDPESGEWFVYVGRYPEGYAMGEGKTMDCVVYRSKDEGSSWERLGKVFPEEPFCFDGDTAAVSRAPDVSVVYADGRYHMAYDWASANTTWATAMNPPEGADNGIGYAWADRPEGPFHRTGVPIYRTSAHPPARGKYRRGYAATLLRREKDWMVLAMTDSGANHSWALVGMASDQPEGPYSDPVFLRCVDDGYFHPPLLEFYPAFQHDGYIYAPSTSVALNRDFEVVFRAKAEDAMKPEAWEIFQHGSVWHSEPVEHEHYGIWGQTFTGFVDDEGIFHVMFPSRDTKGMGTINIASRPWSRPYREHGFIMGAHLGPSLTLLRKAYGAFRLDAELAFKGTVSLLWGYEAPLGPDRPTSDSTLHPLALTRHRRLTLGPDGWRAAQSGEGGQEVVLASGSLPELREEGGLRKVSAAIEHGADGPTKLIVDGKVVGEIDSPSPVAPLGIYLESNSHVEVERFAVTGKPLPAKACLLATEGILGAGAADGFWAAVEDEAFRFGVGAVSAKAGARAKWNFTGTGFALWARRGPDFGKAVLCVDGERREVLDFHRPSAEPSQVVFSASGLESGGHAVAVELEEGTIALDVLEVAW